MPRYSTRSRTYRRESDDSIEGSVDWDAVEGGDEAHQHPMGPTKEEEAPAVDPWSGKTQGSHHMIQVCTYHSEDHWSRYTTAY
jgi:hypothetical protein